MSKHVHEHITTSIIEAIERGVRPWRMPWAAGQLAPMNLVTQRPYRGLNCFLTGMAGYRSPYWMTVAQANAHGARIRRGEKGTPIVFWQPRARQNRSADLPEGPEGGDARAQPRKGGFLLRLYYVFNVDQVEGLRLPQELLYPERRIEVASIEAAERVAQGYAGGPVILHGGDRAGYARSQDTVLLPEPFRFESMDAYYATLFHELAHSTGHVFRLNRKSLQEFESFGDHAYSSEELVAEMAAAFLCAEAGISEPTLEASAEYLAGWLTRLRAEPSLLLSCAGKAQRAADWVLGRAAAGSSREDAVPGEVA